MDEKKETRIIKAQKGFQDFFTRTSVDFCVGGGVLNCGKSFAAVLAMAEPSIDPRFRACFLRNNLSDIRSGGGLLSEFKNVYGDGVTTVESGEPHVDFSSGARVDLTHLSDQGREKVLQRFRGRQYSVIYFDEGTNFEWDAFTAIYSRNRSDSKWSGHVLMTTNPKRSHWLRIFLDWYIGTDGFIIEDRAGVVRYWYVNGESVKDVVWGDSKAEVYAKCKVPIDRALSKINGKDGKATYQDMIKSFTFYLGRMSENKASIDNNKGYAGSVAVMGGRTAMANLEGNWNIDPDEDLDAPINPTAANEVFFNDPQVNGDKWITADLADYGNDNLVVICWDCFHIIDIMIIGQSTPRQNAERIQLMAERHKVGDDHIIYDATAGRYINDYIPDAIPYISMSQPRGLYGRMAFILKDECYQRLVQMICKGLISCEEEVALRPYVHIKLKQEITVQTEFLEECSVVRFKEVGSGKKRLMNKKEMNQMLGKGRSMDLLDACAMRMYPILEYELGSELESTMPEYVDEETDVFGRRSIYDNSTWA